MSQVVCERNLGSDAAPLEVRNRGGKDAFVRKNAEKSLAAGVASVCGKIQVTFQSNQSAFFNAVT